MFLRLGLTAFGGPAAHVALMRREVVERRRWLPEPEFLRMFAACSLIPGPSSTELAIYLGYRRAGWRGLLLAGVLFILPAMVIMMALAWAYSRFSSQPVLNGILYVVRPVVVGIVAWAALDLGRRVFRRWWLVPVGAGAVALMLVGVSPLLVLAAGGAAALAVAAGPAGSLLLAAASPLAAGVAPPEWDRLWVLFLTFLKIGAVSFGSGYVLLAFLQDDLVRGLHWISERQLIDAVAVGQATPGPVFTTATFVGYLVAGLPGALLATVGIFLPGFVLVPFLGGIVAEVGRRRWLQSFLDGVNAAALGLVVAVTLELARASIVDWVTALLAAGGLAASVLRARR